MSRCAKDVSTPRTHRLHSQLLLRYVKKRFVPGSCVCPTRCPAPFGTMAESAALLSSLSSLSLVEGDIVVVVGLDNAKHFNFQPGIIPAAEAPEGRVPVRLLHQQHTLSCRRQNLLRAAHADDRAALLTRVVWERQLEMRVVRNFLLNKLLGEEGLCLEVASHFPVRTTMALTTGFAMGRIVPNWSVVALSPNGELQWRPIHDHAGHQAVFGVEKIPDGIVRIDCAVVSIGSGRFVVAGGCDKHPRLAGRFFRSAFIYDALTHAVEPLPDMPCDRHGCNGACIGEDVYIVGGGYVSSAGTTCSRLHLPTRRWFALPEAEWSVATATSADRSDERISVRRQLAGSTLAFVPVAAVWGRLVVLVEGIPFAFNPAAAEAGWNLCADYDETLSLNLGKNAQASVEWADRHLVVSSGRDAGISGCHVAALTFDFPPGRPLPGEEGEPDDRADSPSWARGRWTRLDSPGSSRIGCGLCVVMDRLYISGGVDEDAQGGGRFDGSVARWGGTLADFDKGNLGSIRAWQKVKGLELPTAMHAHASLSVPWLPAMNA